MIIPRTAGQSCHYARIRLRAIFYRSQCKLCDVLNSSASLLKLNEWNDGIMRMLVSETIYSSKECPRGTDIPKTRVILSILHPSSLSNLFSRVSYCPEVKLRPILNLFHSVSLYIGSEEDIRSALCTLLAMSIQQGTRLAE